MRYARTRIVIRLIAMRVRSSCMCLPPVLWTVRLNSTSYEVTEGPHRPLITGNEAIGAQAAPKAGPNGIYWIKRGSSGNALMRMRR